MVAQRRAAERALARSILSTFGVFLLGATPVAAQYGGGPSGRPGQGHSPASASPSGPVPRSRPAVSPPSRAPIKMTEIFGVGIVRAIDVQAERITIAYEPIEGINWPAGAMPFAVAKSTLLEGITVGEKVRFRLESQRIAELTPFLPQQGPGAGGKGAKQ